MGNTVYVRLKEDKKVLEVTESLVQECESHINMVDRSTEGLAKSVDSLRTSCEMLIKQLETEGRTSQESKSDSSKIGDSILLAHTLIETINSSVSDFEFVMMESISKLFHFLANIGERYTIQTEEYHLDFMIDMYRSQNTDTVVEDEIPYLDARLRSLQKKIENLQTLRNLDKKEIENLNKRETIYRQEIGTLEGRIESLKKELGEMLREQYLVAEQSDNKTKTTSQYQNEEEFMDIFEEKELADLKMENSALKHQLQKKEKDMAMVKGINDDALKQKNDVIEILKQKLDRQMRTDANKVDKETMTNQDRQNHDNVNRAETKTLQRDLSEEDQEIGTENDTFADDLGVSLKEDREKRLKEEIHSLKKEIDVLKYHTVQTVLEYNALRSTRSERERYDDLYKALQVEMTQCKIVLQIQEYVPSKIVRVPHDKAIVIPLSYPSYMNGIKQKIKQAVADLTAAPNIAVILFHNTSDGRLQTEIEKPVEREMNNLGGIFRFGFSYSRQPDRSDRNQENFNALMQFLKSVGSELKYISR